MNTAPQAAQRGFEAVFFDVMVHTTMLPQLAGHASSQRSDQHKSSF
jgi:hypothetical protein